MKLSRFVVIMLPQTIIYIVSFLVSWICIPANYTIPRIDFILDAILTCAATFSGFTLTVISILLSFSKSTVITYLNNHGGIEELRVRYTWSLILGMILILVCLVIGGMIGPSNSLAKWQIVVGLIISIAYFYNLLSSGRYLLKTIALATSPPPQVSEDISEPTGQYRVN